MNENLVIGLILAGALIFCLSTFVGIMKTEAHGNVKQIVGALLGVVLAVDIFAIVILVASLVNGIPFFVQGRVWFGYNSKWAMYFSDTSTTKSIVIGIVLLAGLLVFGGIFFGLLESDANGNFKQIVGALLGAILSVVIFASVVFVVALVKGVSFYAQGNEWLNSLSRFATIFVNK